jgi:glucose-1-phosphate adenylyltransferase
VGRGDEIRRAILDKHVKIGQGARVGIDPSEDRKRGFLISDDGVTCVPKGIVIA